MVSAIDEQVTAHSCLLTMQVVVLNPASAGADVRRAAAYAAEVLAGAITDLAIEGTPTADGHAEPASAVVTITIAYQAQATCPQEAVAAGYRALFRFEPAARQIAAAVGGRLKNTRISAVEAQPAGA